MKRNFFFSSLVLATWYEMLYVLPLALLMRLYLVWSMTWPFSLYFGPKLSSLPFGNPNQQCFVSQSAYFWCEWVRSHFWVLVELNLCLTKCRYWWWLHYILKNINLISECTCRGQEVKEALRAQMEVQRRLHEQVEVRLCLLFGLSSESWILWKLLSKACW